MLPLVLSSGPSTMPSTQGPKGLLKKSVRASFPIKSVFQSRSQPLAASKAQVPRLPAMP